MTIVITTNEPREIRDLFEDKVEQLMDFDILLYTRKCCVTIERKQIPGDFLSSIQDGRLARELRAMKDISSIRIVLLHGKFIFRKDGELAAYGHQQWTKKGIRNLLRTLQYVEGVFIEQAETDDELVEVVNELQDYFDKDKHTSMRTRPVIDTDWLVPSRDERVQYFYQGIPHIGATKARKLVEHFPNPIDLYPATVADIQKIPGFGKTLANSVYNFLRTGEK